MKMKRIVPVIILAAILSVTASSCHKAKKETVNEVPPVPVVAEKPSVGTITDWFKTTCELRSPMETMVSFPTGGRLIDMTVDEGDHVIAGQILARVDTTQLSAQYSAIQNQVSAAQRQAEAAALGAQASQAQVGTAQAVFDQAQRDYDRIQNLRNENVATESELERAKLQLETSEIGLKAAKDGAEAASAQAEAAKSAAQAAQDQSAQVAKILEDATLKAPFGGLVSDRYVEPGTVVGPGTPIFRVVGEGSAVGDRLEIRFDIPEVIVSKVFVGTEITIGLLSCETELKPKIDKIGGEIRSGTRTVEVISYIPMDTLCLLPGMFGTVKVPLEIHNNAIIVPEKAVIDFEGKKIVYVSKGDTAVKREVVTGILENENIEILEGLTATDEVIVVGNRFLTDGAKITKGAQSQNPTGTDTGQATENTGGGA